MKLSCGTDLTEINRIKKSLDNPNFLKRVFSQNEIKLFESKSFALQTIAANFCGKEAFSKALGTGIRGFKLTEVEILRDNLGKPYINLLGNAKEIAQSKNLSFDISLSHSENYAIAMVIAFES